MGRVFSAAGSISCLKIYLTASKGTNLAQILVLSCSPPTPLPGTKNPATRSSNPPQSIKCQGLSLIRGSKNACAHDLYLAEPSEERRHDVPWAAHPKAESTFWLLGELVPRSAGAGWTGQFLAAGMASFGTAEPLLLWKLQDAAPKGEMGEAAAMQNSLQRAYMFLPAPCHSPKHFGNTWLLHIKVRFWKY